MCARSGISGLVVTLSDTGELRVSYMGTDPPVGAVNPVDSKELNYDDMDEEHRKLLGIIRETQSGTVRSLLFWPVLARELCLLCAFYSPDTRAEPRDKILLRAQVPVTLDPVVEGDDDWNAMPSAALTQITCRLFVSFSGATEPARNVAVNIKVPDAVVARQTSFVIPSVGAHRTRV
jgi:hypothetical protein